MTTQIEPSPNTPMLPSENDKVLILSPKNNGKVLIREDTALNNLSGCVGCVRPHFACSKEKWSVLCWGKQHTGKKFYTILLVLSTVFVASLIGTVFFCFTNPINDAVLSSMVIRNNSLAFKFWEKPNVQPLMKVHLFNYTNWERVRDGYEEKLHVQDVGPIVYSQQLERVNIAFDEDRLSYQEKSIFKYVPLKNSASQYDIVKVPNLPLLGAVTKALTMPYFVQSTIAGFLKWSNHPDPFVTLPIHRFLWGYDDNIIDTVKPVLSLRGELNFENFGLLVTKNRTSTDRFTINTGENDISKMNILEEFNGESQLSYWGTPLCNSIEASDGTIFPPSLLNKVTPLEVFLPNLCRRLPFHYEKDVAIGDGINLYRYRLKDDAFNDEANDRCYCDLDTGVCPPSGVINVTACSVAPAMASFPHFMHGAKFLHESITGLKPDPAKHESYLDIHPTLGIALHGKSCLQINMQVKKSGILSSFSFLPQDLLLPVAWIEMSVEELPEGLRSLVYHGTYSTAAVQLGLSIFCILTLFFSSICLFCMFLTRRKKPCATVKKVIVELDTRSKMIS